MHFVYVIQSIKTGEVYKGLTDNIDRRLTQHMTGKSRSTKSKLPLRLVHVEICSSRTEARVLEKFFKSGFGRETILEIIDNMRMW